MGIDLCALLNLLIFFYLKEEKIFIITNKRKILIKFSGF